MAVSKDLVIGLAGLGTVGSGLVQLLKNNAAEIEQRTGKKIFVKYVAVRNIDVKREIPKEAQLINDPLLMAEDPEVQVIVELIGGTTLAGTLIKTLDIDGFDAAHKLKLLIRLAWGVHYPYEKLSVQGIRNISAMDIAFARSLGYSIKLLGQAGLTHDEIEAAVSPVLIPSSAMLARVDGAFNAIHINGNAVGSLFLHGLGAGSLPTASAVLGDIMSLMKDIYDSTGYVMQKLPLASMAKPEDSVSSWYLRLMVHDTVGVLRDIAGIFAKHSISIAQVIQKKKQENGVPLVFMTHETTVEAMKNALQEIEATKILNCKPVAFRVLELL